MLVEREHLAPAGLPYLLGLLAALVLSALAILATAAFAPLLLIGLIPIALVLFVMLFGIFTVDPNEAKVLQLFGRYVGTAKQPGLRWANPFYTKHKISLRV